jgi:CRP/FNR family cyclic AMP-dependent transcriptional regulator
MTICSFVQIDLRCHGFVNQPATSPSGAIVNEFRMRFCQADDTRRTLLTRFHERNPLVALTAQTILERTRLFRGLPAATIQQISALSIRRSYSNGAIVFSQADPGDSLYGVVTGKIRISASSPSGREMFLNIMEPGDTFGEIALLDGRHRTATASAISQSELIIITRDHFLELLKREPELVSHVVQLLCERIRWTSGLAEESALLSVPERLARRLLSLGQLHGHETPNGVELDISHEEVARFLGLSRQVVNQYLQNWKVQGWLALGRGKIVIVDEHALQNVDAADLSPHVAAISEPK